MSHRHDPFRPHDPANPRRGANIDPSKFESFRPLVTHLRNSGKTHDQIVDYLSKDKGALEAGFQPTRAQIIARLAKWTKGDPGSSPTTTHPVKSFDSRVSSSLSDSQNQPLCSGSPAIAPAANAAHDVRPEASIIRQTMDASGFSFSNSDTPGFKDQSNYLFSIGLSPVSRNSADSVPQGDPITRTSTHDHPFPNVVLGSASSQVDSSAPPLTQTHSRLGLGLEPGNQESIAINDHLPTFSHSRTSSMSLDQKSFNETSKRARYALAETQSMMSNMIPSMTALSVSTEQRSEGSGRSTSSSGKQVRSPASLAGPVYFASSTSGYQRLISSSSHSHVSRQPLERILGLSEVAAGFVKARSCSLAACQHFGRNNAQLFREDPVVFYHAAAQAQRLGQRGLAQQCFECFNLVRAHNELAAWAWDKLMPDLIAAEEVDGELTEGQSKINQTFLRSGEDGFMQLRASPLTCAPRTGDGDMLLINWSQLPAPVRVQEFEQRWGMEITPSGK